MIDTDLLVTGLCWLLVLAVLLFLLIYSLTNTSVEKQIKIGSKWGTSEMYCTVIDIKSTGNFQWENYGEWCGYVDRRTTLIVVKFNTGEIKEYSENTFIARFSELIISPS